MRVRTDALEPATARLRLANVLSGGALRPPGLPPAAVLCVRRLADPRPRTLTLGPGDVRPPPEWERAFVSALEDLLRSAARPAREAVPANAEAVLFADQAEMLACLARDRCHGATWTRWWWRSLVPNLGAHPDAEVAMWLERPEHAPAALEIVAARGDAVSFAGTIPPVAATELAARVAAAFAAPDLRGAILEPVEPLPADHVAAGSEALDPPWRELASASGAAPLRPEQQLMLGTLLMLRCAAGVARTRAFAAEVRRWRAAVARPRSPVGLPRPVAAQHPEPPAPPPPASGGPHPNAASAHEPDAAARPRSGPSVPHPSVDPTPPIPTDLKPAGLRFTAPAPDASAARETRPASGPSPPPAFGLVEVPPPLDRSPATPRAPHPGRPAAPTPAPVEDTRGSTADLPAPSVEPAPASRARRRSAAIQPPAPRRAGGHPEPGVPAEAPAAGVTVTRLGGLFYLVNLALYLDLYSDFTRPREPGIALNPWELVELLGAWLLGGRPDDPVWDLLAELAGRAPGEPAGRGFAPPRRWRVPPAWLEPFAPDGAWRWSSAGGLLRIVHPAGFTVVAVPRDDRAPAVQLRAELRRLGRPFPSMVRSTLQREPARVLARWVARLGGYAHARLAAALGLADPGAVGEAVLAHRAEVLVTPTHVDVRLLLAELPLDLRLAGLDRDPGWIPAAGRFVAFHFS